MRSSACEASLVCNVREHEVTGLGERQRDRDRVEVAHFAEQDDVGVFTQGAAQTVGEAAHVGADLALVDHRHLVVVQVLDGVLDGEDVHRLGLVDAVDHRRQRRALARAGRAHDEHETVRPVQQIVWHAAGAPSSSSERTR